jgi:hypothetical protein
MSFERFSTSDIYMFEHVGGFIECCACNITLPWDGELFGFARLATPREALEHLDQHEMNGDDIGGARNRIIKDYPDLDIEIQPFVRSHPPKAFRDIGNGE